MKRFILALLLTVMSVISSPLYSESGACGCDCLLEAIRDPTTNPADLPGLIKAYEDYDCI